MMQWLPTLSQKYFYFSTKSRHLSFHHSNSNQYHAVLAHEGGQDDKGEVHLSHWLPLFFLHVSLQQDMGTSSNFTQS